MVGLQDAQQRLERAIARLETALESSGERRRAALARLEADRERGPEIEELVRALDEAREDNAILVDEQERTATQIDRIIGRLHRVLEQAEGPAGRPAERPTDQGAAP